MNSLVTQIGMMVLAVGILWLYVRPTFINIGVLQDSITVYETEREKVIDVNATLAQLVTKANSITEENKQAMLTYLPDYIDDVAVSRDILIIAETAGVFLRTVRYNGVLQNFTEEESDIPAPVKHNFYVNLSGNYEQIKLFLSLLEQNNYPLEIRTLSLVTTESELMESTATIFTYSHKQPI